MLRLVELHVRKFRDLVDGGPLRFGPGPVFLLGPNGSGKTTLLELIGVLLGDDLGPLFREEDAVELSWVLEAEGVGETPTTRLELSLSIDARPRLTKDERTGRRARRGWKITGTLPARTPMEETIQFEQTLTEPLRAWLSSGDKIELNVPGHLVPNDPKWMFEIAIELPISEAEGNREIVAADRLDLIYDHYSIGPAPRSDEALLQYSKITGAHKNSVRIEERSGEVDVSHDVPQWADLPANNLQKPQDHPDLKLLTRLLGAEGFDIRPRLILEDGRGRRRYQGFDIYIYWSGGAKHHHSELSFGQKRLIALIWQIGLNPELPLLTDEMTNGLHAGWVQEIVDHLGPRQGFHAVQNPLLLDRYGPGQSAEEIAGRFVLCTVETAERGRQWRWRSPTPEECERLWAAYIAGYQHLSELLISEGLW